MPKSDLGSPVAATTSPDAWEKAKTISTVLATVVLPVVVVFVGNQFSSAIKEREIEGKFVELAVSILRDPPNPQSNNIRDWATKVIDKYSRVPLSPELAHDLINNTPLPGASATVRDAQAMLGALGYYSGPADGILGPATQTAVRRFQEANDLLPDGVPGPQTLESIIDQYGKRQSR